MVFLVQFDEALLTSCLERADWPREKLLVC